MNEHAQLLSWLLSDIVIDQVTILCDDADCGDPGHTSAIESLYQGIVSALLEAGDTCSMQKEKYCKQVADCHDVCDEYHTLATNAFHLWCLNSRSWPWPIY